MPSLTYIGEPDRAYPSLGLEPVPGQSYDVEADPEDGRWSTSAAKPFAFSAPAEPTPSVTPEPTPTTTEA